MANKRLFGTDGIRGVAMDTLTTELSMNLGKALGTFLYAERKITGRKPVVVIGRDTRPSSDALEHALAAGLNAAGADAVRYENVVTTPMVAYTLRKEHADAGVMISASHNTYEFNGIKVFGSTGQKLPDSEEDALQKIIDTNAYDIKTGLHVGNVRLLSDSGGYVSNISKLFPHGADKGFVLDCANGSAGAVADLIFPNADIINKTGGQINDNCGSTHIESLQAHIKSGSFAGGFAGGFAFDGDADRCIAVDENGDVVDGDQIITIFALDLKQRGELANNTVVVTVMTNLGIVKFLRARGITVVAAAVGDRYVIEEMEKRGAVLGGEQSGHIILKNLAGTGDGPQTAAAMLAVLSRNKDRTFSQMIEEIPLYHQKLVGVKVSADFNHTWTENTALRKKIAEAEKAFGETGRILCRASGTEPLFRILTEGKDKVLTESWADDVADLVRKLNEDSKLG